LTIHTTHLQSPVTSITRSMTSPCPRASSSWIDAPAWSWH
jgi:hypothetical protein